MSNKLKQKPRKFYHFDNSASGSAVSDEYELIREAADDEFSNKKLSHVKRAVNLFNDLDLDDYLSKSNDELLEPEFLRDRHSFVKSDNSERNNDHLIRSNENSTCSFNFTSNHQNNSNHFSSNIFPLRKVTLLDISEDFKKLQQDLNSFISYDFAVYDKPKQEWMIANLLQKKLMLQQKILKYVSEVDSKKDYQICFKKLDDLAELETNILELLDHLQSKCYQNVYQQRLINQPLLHYQNKKSMIKNQFKQCAHDLTSFTYNSYEKNSVPRLELNNESSNVNTNNTTSSLNDSSTQGQINTLLLNTINQIFWSNSCQQKEIDNLKNIIEKLRKTVERNGNQQASLNRNTLIGTKNEQETNSTVNHSVPTLSCLNLQNWNRSSQALNNKVAPGNRANNYWDNFRSYSHQNRFVTNSSPDHRSNPVRNNESPVFCNKLIDINSVDVNLFHNIQNEDNSFHNRNKNNLKSSDEHRKNLQVANNETCVDASNSTNDISNESDHLDPDLEQSLRSLYENNVVNNNSDILFQKSQIDVSLRKNILQEVVFFINRNEDKPDYLMQLFQELKIISNNDNSRKNLIRALRILTHEQNSENQDNDRQNENGNSSNETHQEVDESDSENED